MERSSATPPVPIPSATVILVRHSAGALQVYLLRRHTGSGFMAGNYVFPGGMLDNDDGDISFWRERVDLTPEDIALRLGDGTGLDRILPFAVAAVRETFEEAGVLLACNKGLSEEDTAEAFAGLDPQRSAGALADGWFSKTVRERQWTLTISALGRWAHWITPERMKRRYDTRFFLAVLPRGQHCRPDNRETVDGLWIEPEAALRANLSGEIPLSPPTLVTLHELLTYASLEALRSALQNRSWAPPRLPRLILRQDEPIILQPWDPDYVRAQVRVPAGDLSDRQVPVGHPFSRIWRHRGIWRPVMS
jgi:8-oxo-dGTP pyrophosphatase MutT (NUDIX family)